MNELETKEPIQSGTVISYHGNRIVVMVGDKKLNCHLHRNQSLPVVGDQVKIKTESKEDSSITLIETRKTVFSRGDKKGNLKALAANVDLVALVMAPPPVFSDFLIDRYLVAIELQHLKPIIILNKIDLLTRKSKKEMEALLSPYRSLYEIVLSTTIRDKGLNQLKTILKNKSSVFIGPSGVGKSSIIAKLTDNPIIKIGPVSPKGSGKHTTTATHLYPLKAAGSLIDSPGIREFDLWKVDQPSILKSFKEFTPFLNQCRFRDCLHLVEPDCTVQNAVEGGKISRNRYENYKKLIQLFTHDK